MTAPIKLRRVDFWASDWLVGTVKLTLNQRGLYITACAMIYDAGGPISKVDLRRMAGGRSQTFDALLLGLIDKGKLQLRDGMIDQVRCEREIARARDRMTDRTKSVNGSYKKVAFPSPTQVNETNDLPSPTRGRARGKGYQANKEEDKILEGGLGREDAPSGETPPAPRPEPVGAGMPGAAGPVDPEHAAYVDAAVERATAALRGDVPKGIRDPTAYKAAVKDAKFTNLVKAVNAWVGSGLDGEAQWAAWEVLDAAEKAETRAAMTPVARKALDKIVEMYRGSSAGMEAAA